MNWRVQIGTSEYCTEEFVLRYLSSGQSVIIYAVYLGDDENSEFSYCSVQQGGDNDSGNHIETDGKTIYWTDFIDYSISNTSLSQSYQVGNISYQLPENWVLQEKEESEFYLSTHPSGTCFLIALYEKEPLTEEDIEYFKNAGFYMLLSEQYSNIVNLEEAAFVQIHENVFYYPFSANDFNNTASFYGTCIIYDSHLYMFYCGAVNRASGSLVETIDSILETITFE
ncbi:hypothetical protein LJC04_02980 [Ruminococcaceae bacterium OttesenSCG-928-O06]|nr:hypothetical protein [Ruminococcaceae bacterium OttesenSCG-928-O06]